MKKIIANKAICIIIMAILIIAGFFLGGMWSLNARYERISAHRVAMPELYNAEAAKYNEQLEKFPANVISTVMPTKGALEYDHNAEEAFDIYGMIPDVSILKSIGILVVLLVIGGLIKLIY